MASYETSLQTKCILFEESTPILAFFFLVGTTAFDAALKKGDKAGGTEDVKPLDSNTQVQVAIMATVSTAACQATLSYTLPGFRP